MRGSRAGLAAVNPLGAWRAARRGLRPEWKPTAPWPAQPGTADPGDPGNVMRVRSSAFNDYAFIAPRHAKDGGNEPPELEWSPAPQGTRELALLVEDPDAPAGTFLHWLVTGIDPEVSPLSTPPTPSGPSTRTASVSAGTAAPCRQLGTTRIVTCSGSTPSPSRSPRRTPLMLTASAPGSTSTRSRREHSRVSTSADRVSRERTLRSWPAVGLGVHELLAAVDVERRARDGGVRHQVHDKSGDVLGETTRRMGRRVRSSSRRASSPSPRIVAESGVSTNPGATIVTRIGASSGQAPYERGHRGGDRGDHGTAPRASPGGAADQHQASVGRNASFARVAT